MSQIAIGFLLVNAVLLLLLPRRWAPIPFLIGATYMTLGQIIVVGPFNFTIIRILVAVGLVRVIIKREWLAGGMNGLDWLMLLWSAWALLSSVFHNNPTEALIFRLGLVYNTCGIYFLIRIFCHSIDEVVGLCRITAFLLVPVAVEMLNEHLTNYNIFAVLGGLPLNPEVRGGRLRAQGPFAHSILAGTVGAVSLPLMIGLWQQHRISAIAGIGACLIMIAASSSSGPVLSAMAAIAALFMWPLRRNMRLIRWLALFGYVGMDLVMKAPAYYIIGRINLTGSSTGWHRAALIESALNHIDEWWLGGTDHTRHWMPTGVSWNEAHTDITNHYLRMGVVGGLPLMFLFIAIIIKGFSYVGQTIHHSSRLPRNAQFMVWALGASLFAHVATCISVSYFDQSFLFLYLTLVTISSTRNEVVNNHEY